jgi:hypothetical protein
MHEVQAAPVRAGVFSTVLQAERAVRKLLNAGFSSQEITVVCSDETKTRWLKEFEHQVPAGSKTPAAAAAGSVIGAALGGFTALAAGIATGGLALVAAGGLAAWTGGMVGGLVGAMLTRGFEKELANYYDQSVAAGKVLVAVELHEDAPEASLSKAEQIFAESGAEPRPLPEG